MTSEKTSDTISQNIEHNRTVNEEGEARMEVDMIERRQQRRADLKAQIVVRGLDAPESGEDGVIGRIINVSLSGAYAMVPASFPFAPGSTVAVSVSIPQEATRQFPFVRLLGKGWVVRVDRSHARAHKRPAASHAKEGAQGGALNLQEILGSGEEAGVAIAFSRNVTALGAVGATYQ